jgi:hypothetical protein
VQEPDARDPRIHITPVTARTEGAPPRARREAPNRREGAESRAGGLGGAAPHREAPNRRDGGEPIAKGSGGAAQPRNHGRKAGYGPPKRRPRAEG